MTRHGWLAILLAAWLALSGLGWWQASRSALASLEAQLHSSLPERINAAGINRVDQQGLADYLARRIEQDLGHILGYGPLSLVRQCSARVLGLRGNELGTLGTGEQQITLTWQGSSGQEQLNLGVRCHMHWPTLLASQLLLALAGLGLIRLIPAPLSDQRRRWIRRLAGSGVDPWQARRLTTGLDCYTQVQRQLADMLLTAGKLDPADIIHRVENPQMAGLDEPRLPWFALALHLHGGDDAKALAIAREEPGLVLDPAGLTAICHGIPVRLSSTPFFYYYWYALRRAGDDGGWFTNPPSNRPDSEAGEQLIALMERHGGHGKAVKDLRDKGLRAKTLDQNRSKVKEEMAQVLGEFLAADYLFEMERDPRTARYRYRLALPPERIRLP